MNKLKNTNPELRKHLNINQNYELIYVYDFEDKDKENSIMLSGRQIETALNDLKNLNERQLNFYKEKYEGRLIKAARLALNIPFEEGYDKTFLQRAKSANEGCIDCREYMRHFFATCVALHLKEIHQNFSQYFVLYNHNIFVVYDGKAKIEFEAA